MIPKAPLFTFISLRLLSWREMIILVSEVIVFMMNGAHMRMESEERS